MITAIKTQEMSSKRMTILLTEEQSTLISKLSAYMDSDQGRVIRMSIDSLIDILENNKELKVNEPKTKFFIDSLRKFLK